MSLSDDLRRASAPPVLESSLGRIWQHHGKTGFAVLTAWRGGREGKRGESEDLGKGKYRYQGEVGVWRTVMGRHLFISDRNQEAMRNLHADLKSAGFGFVPVEGVGQEDEDGKIVQATEPSVLIPNKKRGGGKAEPGELRALAMRLGKKYGQTAVLIHDPEKGTEIITPDGEVLDHAKGFSPNSVGQFFTRLRKGQTFRLEDLRWWGLRYGDPPGNWIEGMAMENQGRAEIRRCSDVLADWLREVGAA